MKEIPFFQVSRARLWAAIFLPTVMGTVLAQEVTITDLGTLGGSGSIAYDVSAGGLVVVGSGYTADGLLRAFRWTAAGNMQNLGILPGGELSTANGVSADGSVIVGVSGSVNSSSAFRWTAASGMVDIGNFGGELTSASGISADGNVIVGSSRISDIPPVDRAFRWTSADGMESLGTLGGTSSFARGVSANGSVIVGNSQIPNGNINAFRWDAASGMESIGTLGGNFSSANSVSGDGSVIVGYSRIVSTEDRAFRWTEAQGMQNLGVLPGYAESVAYGVSNNGTVIVGESSTGISDSRAFRWTEAEGMQDLGTLGGDTSLASAVSDDGSVIAGRSTTASGDEHATLWKFVVSPPEGPDVLPPVIVDVDNTVKTVAALANDTFAVMEMQRLALGKLQHRCDVSRAGEICYSAITDLGGFDGNVDALGGATIGYGFTEHFSAGVTLGHSLWQDLPGSFERNNSNIGGGLYAQWKDTTATGDWYLRGSLAGNRYHVQPARRVFGVTEAGKGDSHITGWSASVELGQSHHVADQARFGYYGGLRHGALKMDAYTESNAAFPFSYSDVSYRLTSLYAGTHYAMPLADAVTWSMNAEIEQDLSQDAPSVTASADYIGTLRFNADPDRTRGVLSTSLSYDMNDSVSLSATPYIAHTAVSEAVVGTMLKLYGKF